MDGNQQAGMNLPVHHLVEKNGEAEPEKAHHDGRNAGQDIKQQAEKTP